MAYQSVNPYDGTTLETFAEFYSQSIENTLAFLDGKPVRVMQRRPS